MTDRLNALTIVLDRDIRVDDAEALISAIKMMRGVQDVQPHVSRLEDHIAYERARHDLGQKLWDILYPKKAER